jgi:hypothetical protein
MTYHLGRLTAYATIGLVFGLVGKVSLWHYSRKCQYLLGLHDYNRFNSRKKIAKFNFSQPIFQISF